MENPIEKIKEIRKALDRIGEKTGERIEIVAATKTRPVSEILQLKKSEIDFVAGENRAQELTEKYVPDLTWDFIGRLQSNKVKYVIDKVRLIHSLDRLPLLEEINRQAAKLNKVQECLIEVNLGREEEKGGVFIENVRDFLMEAKKFGNVKTVGLMGVAPLLAEESELRKMFKEAYVLYSDLKEAESFKYLSMGMSNDYLIAAECGSNMVRIGRGIFGERNT